MDLTPSQRQALRVLDWLYDPREFRATGRTTILALSFLRRLLVFEPTSRDGWIEVEDHVSGTRDLDRHLVRVIESMAQSIGCHGIEVHPNQLRVRLTPGYRVTLEMTNAVTEFGDLPEDSLGLTQAQDDDLHAFLFFMRDSHAPRRPDLIPTWNEPVFPSKRKDAPLKPKRSLWEHLAEDDLTNM